MSCMAKEWKQAIGASTSAHIALVSLLVQIVAHDDRGRLTKLTARRRFWYRGCGGR